MSFGTSLWSGRVAAAVNVQAIIVVKTTVYAQESLRRTNLFRAKDLKVSTTAVRLSLLTAMPISDLGVASAISQATTDATLCLTAEAGRMERPIPASTSEISVGISPAV